jgi:mono/diheme cytochrome c family protein
MKMNFLILATALMIGACSGGSESDQSDAKNEESATTETTTESTSEATDEASGTAQAAVMEAGKKVYDQYCIVCHQADGAGVPNAFPPLIQTDWVQGDKTRLIEIVLNGLTGEIEVNGETYNSAMTPHDFLSDQEVADVLTYVRSSFGNDADAVSAEEVAAVRAQ